MALGTPLVRGSAVRQAGTGDISTSAFTPAANSLLFAFVFSDAGAGSTPAGHAGGTAWTQIETTQAIDVITGVLYACHTGSSPSSAAVTVANATAGGMGVLVSEVPDAGAAAAISAFINQSDAQAELGVATAMSLPAASSLTMAFYGNKGNITLTPPGTALGTASYFYGDRKLVDSYDAAGDSAPVLGKSYSGTYHVGFAVEVIEGTQPLGIDTPPATIEAGTQASVVISNPPTTPTTGNTEVKFDDNLGAAATVDSVSGTGPYTINFTFPLTTTKQFDATGYPLYVEVTTESDTSAAIPYTEPTGYDYTDLVGPVTTSGSILEGYTGDTPVTGDQVVYTTPTAPTSIGFTVGADGEWILDSLPIVDQTVDRYVIQADGTVGTEDTVTYSVGGGGGSSIPNAYRISVGKIAEFLRSEGTYVFVQSNELVFEWLVDEGIVSSSLNEMLHAYLGGLGYTGTINDRMRQWRLDS